MTGAPPSRQLEERLFWQEASPFVRTLGAKIDLDGKNAKMSVRPLPRLAAPNGEGIDPLAAVGLIDDCLSLAIGQSMAPERGIATLDLWFSILRHTTHGDVVATATQLGEAHDIATSRVEVCDERGAFMYGGGNFILGRFPSGAAADPSRAGLFSADGYGGPFCAAIGLSEAGEGAVRMAGSDAVVGWEAGPIVHGGAIAVVLFAAAQRAAPEGQCVRTMALRYLRPAAHRGVLAQAVVDRSAQRASHLSAHAMVEGKIVAAATVVTAPH